MNLVVGASPKPSGLPAQEGLWRLRPGEAPVWVDLELDRETVSAWRRRAARLNLGVDAWLALLVERMLVFTRLSDVGLSLTKVSAEAVRSRTVTRLAPTPALRQWSAQLDGRVTDGPPDDELPTVVLPERLLAQVVPHAVSEVLFAAVGSGDDEEALAVERAATAVGQAADAWAYLTALRLRCA